MIAKISILCFAASYGVALALEVTRLFVRSGLRGALMLGFGAAGLVAHTLFLAHRAWQAETPLSSSFEWYLVAAWILAVMYLYLTVYHPRNPIGLFVLPLVLGLIGVATFWADRDPFPQTRAALVWGRIHGGFLLLGTVAVLIGFAAGLMYLVSAYRLKHKLAPLRGVQLPSLEWLERINSRSLVVSVLMLGIGLLSGLVLNVVNHGKQVDYIPWNDPVVWSSAVMFAWLVAVSLFNGLYKPSRQGRKVAYLTVASFLFLVLALGVNLFVESRHGVSEAERSRGGAPALLPPQREASHAPGPRPSLARRGAEGRR